QNLINILQPLSKPPSLQPANSFRLPRSVRKAFGPASDIAPRLLATFHPAAAPTLYKAWSGVEVPFARVEVYAMRAKVSVFGNNAPMQAIIPPPPGSGAQQPSTPSILGANVRATATTSSTSVGSPVHYQEWALSPTDTANLNVLHLDSANDKV